MRVLLVPNMSYPQAVAAACDLAAMLVEQGLDPVLSAEDAHGCGLERFGVPATDIGELTLAVALGGDGTILRAVHMLDEAEVPLLGVNLGRLGFLSGATSEDIREAVGSALAGDCCIERRITLEAHVVMEGRFVGRYRALNEIAITRGMTGRVVELALSVNGTELMSFGGDGVIVATPTGSTAYALSAGGPIVSPEVGGLVVVPVAPHMLAQRSFVTGPSDIIEVHLPNPARREARLSVDGDATPCRRTIESVTIKRCEHDVLLVKLDGRDFYEVVRTELYGG